MTTDMNTEPETTTDEGGTDWPGLWVALGLIALVAGAVWAWQTSNGDSMTFPIVTLAAGAFLILLGVILRGQQPRSHS